MSGKEERELGGGGENQTSKCIQINGIEKQMKIKTTLEKWLLLNW